MRICYNTRRMRNVETTRALAIAGMLIAGASSAHAGMEVSFDGANVLRHIRSGEATFATGGGELWTAEFSAGSNREERLTVSPSMATSRAYRASDTEIVLAWRDLPLGTERAALDAEVVIDRRADGSLAWRLRFDNRSEKWALLTTDFPRLGRLTANGEADVMLPWKDHGARLFRNRAGGPKESRFQYLGHYPQVAAAFVGSDGLYLAAEDPDARQKTMVVDGEQNIRFHTPVEWGGVPGKAAEGPRYPVVTAPLKGDWWAAARRYRAFALKQKWCAKGPIKDIPAYPRRMAEIPLWINVHCHPAEVSNILVRAKTVFPDFATGLHWHLWQHSGHDVNYPEYFPAQPGTRECIAFCESIGQVPMPYANGRLWSASTSGFLMAEPYAVMKVDGSRAIEKYAPWTPPLAVMCPACPAWRRVMQRFAGRILGELGATSLFLDQIGAAEGQPCYDPGHPHPAGGGGWWYEGYAAALAPIRKAYNDRGAFLTTEGECEAYIGMVDGFLQVVGRTPEDVPFMNAVYSGYTTYFGSPENNDDDPGAFRALQTRELLWGNSLGWFLQDILDRPDKCAILRQLCAFRQRHMDVLAYGNLMDEMRIVSPIGRKTYEWLGRRPHYRLFDKTYRLPPSSFATMPDVIGNWWRRADGRIVLLAANLTDRTQRVEYRVYGSDRTAGAQLAPYELVVRQEVKE